MISLYVDLHFCKWCLCYSLNICSSSSSAFILLALLHDSMVHYQILRQVHITALYPSPSEKNLSGRYQDGEIQRPGADMAHHHQCHHQHPAGSRSTLNKVLVKSQPTSLLIDQSHLWVRPRSTACSLCNQTASLPSEWRLGRGAVILFVYCLHLKLNLGPCAW